MLQELPEGGEAFMRKHQVAVLTYVLPFYAVKKVPGSNPSEHALKNLKRAVQAYKYFLKVSEFKEVIDFQLSIFTLTTYYNTLQYKHKFYFSGINPVEFKVHSKFIIVIIIIIIIIILVIIIIV